MAHRLSLPFFAFKLYFHSGNTIVTPVTDSNVFRIGEPIYMLAGKYAEALQNKVFNKGKYLNILEEYIQGDFIKGEFSLSIPAANDGFSYPDIELRFDYYSTRQEQGYWGILPVLGIESFATDEAGLIKKLEEAVRLDFKRKDRLRAVQEIVATIWYQEVELQRHEMDFKLLGLKELEQEGTEKKERLLPQLAKRVEITGQVAYGRQQELEHFSRALGGNFMRNILLVGPSGVGKTALVWEMVSMNPKLRIWETTASTMIKELMRDTGWQDNISFLCKELAEGEDILYVSNLMELFEVGQYVGNEVSIADYLRTFISRGEITLISECTEEEQAMIELRSPNYLSFFQIIKLEPPQKDLEQIIIQKVKDIAQNRNANIEEKAIKEVLRLNNRFTPYSGLPGKPIRFLESILINQRNKGKKNTATISRSEVIRYFCEETGMPVFMVDPSIPMNPIKIKQQFNENVFGQENAVDQLVDLLASVKTALTKTGKPIASLLFVGPTGVGKTELAKVLAEFIFGHRQRMLRFDMSEYSDPYAVARLTGTGYYNDGLLTSAVRKEPFCVLLFDEIEKADASFYDLLLQVLSEGRLTDSQGKLVDFCSTIIIMTSNIGAKGLSDNRISLGHSADKQQVVEHFLTAVQNYFRPELFNRIDQVIPFEPLDQITVRYVVDREIALLKKREGIQFRRMNLEIEEAVYDFLAEKGYGSKYGARQLQRTIRTALIIPLAEALNAQDFDDQLVVKAVLEDNAVKILTEADPLGLELLLEELDKLNHANHASSLRRQIHKLRASHFFIRLQSELDLLERKKKRKKAQFWKDQSLSDQYSYYLQTLSNVDKLTSEIEKIELAISMSCLDLDTFNPAIIDSIKAWEEAFFQLKIEIYTRLNPKANNCFFSIYGSNIKEILNFYIGILKQKNYDFTAKSIWFRESYYLETVEEFVNGNVESRPREEYIKANINLQKTFQLKPPKKGDKLCGVEFAIFGPCAFLYLKDEAGSQKWKQSDNNYNYYVLLCTNDVHATPTTIHRKSFYSKSNHRRVIEQNTIRDTSLKIHREFNRAKIQEFLFDYFEKRFEFNLNLELL